MKHVEITLRLEVRDDTPERVIELMEDNIAEYVSKEFADDWVPDFVSPPYEGPPTDGCVYIRRR